MPFENHVDGFESDIILMLSSQFLLDPSRAEIALAAQLQDPCFLLVMDLALGTGLGATTPSNQSCLALLLIAPRPFAQRWTGDTVATTDQADVMGLLVDPKPC